MTKLIGKRQDRTKARYFKILKYQAVIVAVLVAVLSLVDWVSAYSALAAGLIYLIPNAYTAKRHFDNRAVKSAQATLAALYAGQIWKMALMATAFALLFVLVKPISVFSLFATLILIQIIQVILQFGVKTDS